MPNASLISVSIVVPTYKEAENLPLLVPQVAAAMRTRGWTWELIVVDDNSTDDTPAVLESLSAMFPQFRYLIRTKERGLSSAVLAGISLAKHDYVVVMDADLSHPPESVPALVDKLIGDDADFVIGSRYVPGGQTEDWSRARWLNSFVATLLSKPLVGDVKDPMAGFFAVRREMLRSADALNPIGYKIALELIVKTHLRHISEVPILFRNRKHGESKLTLKEQFRYLEHLSRLYDYQYPKGSPRAKFLIASGTGAAAAFGVLAALNHAGIMSPLSIPAALLAMIGVTLLFFARYVRTQHDFLVMRQPYSEFALISLAEFIAGLVFAVSTRTNSVYLQLGIGLLILLLVRYTLRKVFLHDLRGIRGTPKPSGSQRLTLAPALPAQNSAGAA